LCGIRIVAVVADAVAATTADAIVVTIVVGVIVMVMVMVTMIVETRATAVVFLVRSMIWHGTNMWNKFTKMRDLLIRR